MQEYLNEAKLGRNKWWLYLASILVILFMWQVVGAIPALILFVGRSIEGVGALGISSSGYSLDGFIAFMSASIFFLVGITLSIRFIHRRGLRTLVTPSHAFDWAHLFLAFGVWFVLSCIMSLVEALLHPGRYVWTFQAGQFIPFLPLALFFIPIQTSTEELFFRGYILQSFGLRIRNVWVLSCISGLIFGLPHLLNPEASVNYFLLGVFYFTFGFSLALLTLRNGSLEIALGVHAANNLFSVLIANYTTTVLPSPSLFTINVLDAVYSVAAALIGMGILIFLFLGPWRKKSEPAIVTEEIH